jgi:DNA-binding transcriptional MocR family regulator
MSDDAPRVSAAWLAERIAEPTAAGIAASIARLVRTGALAPQTQLPTVRALAPRLGVSRGTVSAAWTALRKQQILAGGGRQGIRVQGGLAVSRPARYENIAHLWPERTVNLSRAVPDPALLPDLRPALDHAARDPDLNSYEVVPMSGPLRAATAGSWPFPAEGWMAVNGGYEGLLMLLRTSVVPGEYVAVEDPATPRLLDILDNVGARVVPVPLDTAGAVPSALAEAMAVQPVAFVHEPRSSSFLGASLTPERRDELAGVLAGSGVLVIEDDGLGDLTTQPYHGLGERLPSQTVLVRSYSKSHGPDLRLAVMAGAGDAIERARVHRQFGAGWTSRLLQNALAWLLTDEASRIGVDRAREVYRSRREAMLALLAERGVPARGADGLAVWVPVRSEHEATLVLASHGIAVATATESRTRPGPPAIRVATGIAVPRPEEVADALALAVRAR